MNKSHPNRYSQPSGQGGPARPPTLAELFEYGRQCFHKPDGVAAVAAMEKVVQLHPGYRHSDGDNPYFFLGKIYEVEGRFGQAIIYYSRALAVDPRDEESLIGRGSCFTRTHQHAAAIYDFQRLLGFAKHRRTIPDKHLFLMLAENHRKLDQWGEAVFWGAQAQDADAGNERYRRLYEAMIEAVSDKRLYQSP